MKAKLFSECPNLSYPRPKVDCWNINIVVHGGIATTIFNRPRYIAVICPALALQECILKKRDEPNVRTDAFISAEVDNISRVIKKQKVKSDKFPS